MRRYLAAMLLVVATAWPGAAGAMRIMGETGGPPVGTTINGFYQVLGPESTEPEHAGDFVDPLPEYMPTMPGRTCPTCVAGYVKPRGLQPTAPQP